MQLFIQLPRKIQEIIYYVHVKISFDESVRVVGYPPTDVNQI